MNNNNTNASIAAAIMNADADMEVGVDRSRELSMPIDLGGGRKKRSMKLEVGFPPPPLKYPRSRLWKTMRDRSRLSSHKTVKEMIAQSRLVPESLEMAVRSRLAPRLWWRLLLGNPISHQERSGGDCLESHFAPRLQSHLAPKLW